MLLVHTGCGWVGLELVPAAQVARDAASDAFDAEEAQDGDGEAALGDDAGVATEACSGDCDANGVTLTCRLGEPRAASDAACNGIDDDCDGSIDEDYSVSPTRCGVGVCAASGLRSCVNGVEHDSCTAASPSSSSDDVSGVGNGLDDDCDGSVDEDVIACDTGAHSFEAGSYADIAVPRGCGRVTVRLWGAGGAGGADVGVLGAGGEGGAGGYASFTGAVSGSLTLWIGLGGTAECLTEGMNSGSAAYSGGSGGSDTGAAGGDAMVSGGGEAGTPDTGRAGGRGHFGGGGGGQGFGGLGMSGEGGGGGAASALLMGGALRAVAGGGGGGGGAQSITPLGTLAATGGRGGVGCSGAGQVESGNGGGGGGGGVCQGSAAQAGEDALPAFGEDIPVGRARGGSGGCGAGGAGYAIVSFSR